MEGYSPKDVQKYLHFLSSENGILQQQILGSAILRHIPADRQQRILDAACGPGWLTKLLHGNFPNTEGCDASKDFMAMAEANNPGINFSITDLIRAPLPYAPGSFDIIILNMAAPDMQNFRQALQNLYSLLKPRGLLIMTLPNPYYTYPIGVWKRGFWDVLLGRKPQLRLRQSYAETISTAREFAKGEIIQSFYHPLPYYLNAAHAIGLALSRMEEIKSPEDSARFNLQYQMFRYPLLLLLEFTKPAITGQ